ncbi:MAG: NDP-sugar synthase [Acidobacteria bacterium]|nr:NDP-sugar synthase [Acidobacteriota bacterium]
MTSALVLTAGLATRLRPLSFVRAKAAMPVAGEALVRRILRQLQTAGIRDAVLNLHHLPHTITREVGDGSDLGLRVRYSWEMPVLGSAGGPRQALDLLPSSFLIVNGDTLADVDVAAFVAVHRRTRALVTMAVVPNTEPEKYGGVLVDADGTVTGFARRGASIGSFHFVGMQAAEAAAFASLPPGEPAESFLQLYPRLIDTLPGSVRAFVTNAAFLDIGTPEDYLRTSLRLAAGTAGVLRGSRTHVASTARVEDSVLWDDVEVGPEAALRGCVVADRVRVPDGTTWTAVTLRRAEGGLLAHEERVGHLAVASIR